jgi:ferredoxin-nitrate reductase
MTAARDSIRDVWGPRTEFAGEGRWPERLDERTTHEPERWVKSVCVLCSTGCGLEIGVKDGRMVGVRGDRLDRVNRGRLGPKGLHGWEANNSADRLTGPLIRRGRRLEPASWDEALDLIADRTASVKAQYGAGAVGSRRGVVELQATLTDIIPSHLFIPFHYGNDEIASIGPTAANELTLTDWDPVSKQPQFKFAAVWIQKA